MYRKRLGRVSPNTRPIRVLRRGGTVMLIIWTISIGAAGGLLYGLLSDSRHLWPTLVNVGCSRRLPRAGLIGNAVVGIIAGGLLATTVLRDGSASSTMTGLSWSYACAQLLCSFLASSAISGYTDRRFLRLAVRNAAMAPAADPAAVRALEAATPYDAYVAAGRLAPPLSPIWGPRSGRLATAHDLSSSAASAFDARPRLAVRRVRLPTEAGKRS
jgi:hypothetical protein